MISGSTSLSWRNPSNQPVDELQFHLYYNAFKNSQSTFLKESNGFGLLSRSMEDECGWSWIEITTMMDEEGNDLTSWFAFIHPDDDNDEDETVLQVNLINPILPGEVATYHFEWNAKIPKTAPRTGYNKDYFYFAQWYPKLGVYETAGMRYATEDGWNCHQYHNSGEYYGDFANYDVSLVIPKGMTVGSSGSLINTREDEESTTYTYAVKQVIDFAWTASKHFVVTEQQWKDVSIKLLTYPEHEHFAPRYFKAITSAFEYLDQHVGKYPYETLTIVSPPIHGLFTGGMEYPTLVTSLSTCLLPQGFKTVEGLVVHEFVHQYFQQMVSSHEVEEPWMDEGFTSFYEGRILDEYYGASTSAIDFYGFHAGNKEYNRAEYFSSNNPQIADNTLKSYEYKHGGYGTIAYNKVALWMETLSGLIGAEKMDEVMQVYFESWKFNHPSGQDFFNVVNEVVGEDMTWFFNQTLRSTEICDYKLASITNRKPGTKAGIFETEEGCIDPEKTNQDIYESKVVVHRLGGMQLPIEVQINFDDGTSELETWSGKERSKEFVFSGTKQIISAEIDPEWKIYIEENTINNSLVLVTQKKGLRAYWLQFLSVAQHSLESLNFFI